MAMSNRSMIVGVFEDRAAAEAAVDDLRAAGFTDDQIGIAMRHSDVATTHGEAATTTAADESMAGTGALTGALAGAGLGTLAGFAVLSGMIPVIGPAIAGGTLGIILSNAAAGAGVAGLVGALAGSGYSDEESTYYQGEFEAGRTLVTVHADGRSADATAILRRHGAFDMQSRPEGMSTASSRLSDAGVDLSHSGSGMAGSGMAATGPGVVAAHDRTHGHAHATGATDAETIRLHEEQLHAGTTSKTGHVDIHKDVVSERQTLEVPVEREEVIIERHAPTGGVGTVNAADLAPGEEIRIPIREEQVQVSKEAVVAEEVSIGKRTVRDTEQVTDTVRKEHLRVESQGDVTTRDCDRT